jgi:hypothetical protein
MRPVEVNLHNVVAVSRHPPFQRPGFPEADFPFLIGLLLQDLQGNPCAHFHPNRPQNVADRNGCAAMLPYDLPAVRGSHPQL